MRLGGRARAQQARGEHVGPVDVLPAGGQHTIGRAQRVTGQGRVHAVPADRDRFEQHSPPAQSGAQLGKVRLAQRGRVEALGRCLGLGAALAVHAGARSPGSQIRCLVVGGGHAHDGRPREGRRSPHQVEELAFDQGRHVHGVAQAVQQTGPSDDARADAHDQVDCLRLRAGERLVAQQQERGDAGLSQCARRGDVHADAFSEDQHVGPGLPEGGHGPPRIDQPRPGAGGRICDLVDRFRTPERRLGSVGVQLPQHHVEAREPGGLTRVHDRHPVHRARLRRDWPVGGLGRADRRGERRGRGNRTAGGRVAVVGARRRRRVEPREPQGAFAGVHSPPVLLAGGERLECHHPGGRAEMRIEPA